MQDTQDDAPPTLDELRAEEKKLKGQTIVGAVVVGLLVGVMIYGAANHGFGLGHTLLPLFLIWVVGRNGPVVRSRLRQVRAEIARRGG